jgi:hypothetical protein
MSVVATWAELVVHERVEALARRVGLEGEGDGRDVEAQRVARQGRGARVAVVGEILKEHVVVAPRAAQPSTRRCHATELVNVLTA